MIWKALVITLVVAAVGIGCSKKKKPEEALPDSSAATGIADDTNIQNKDLSFDAQGSDSGNIQGLHTVFFEYDKAAITSEAKSLLSQDAKWIKDHPNLKVQVEGHCDRHGSIEYNLALGERRAKTVRTYLINLGVSGSKLTTISYGKEKPLDSSESDSADSKNRRANFVIQK